MYELLYTLYTIGVEPCGDSTRIAHIEYDLFGKLRSLLLTKEQALLPSAFFSTRFFQSPLIACSAEAKNCLVRSLSLPAIKRSVIKKTLPFQVEPHLPFPLEDASLGWGKISSSEEETTISLVCCLKSSVEEAEEKCSLSNNPSVFAPQSALSTFLSRFLTADTPIVCLHFTDTQVFALLHEKGALLKAVTSTKPLNPFTQTDLPFIKQLVFSLTANTSKEAHLLCTGLPDCAQAASKLADAVNMNACDTSSLKSINTSTQKLLEYAVPIGTALSVTFAPSYCLAGKEKEPLVVVKEWKNTLFFSVFASLLLMFALTFSYISQEKMKKQQIKNCTETIAQTLLQEGHPFKETASLESKEKLAALKKHLETLPLTAPLSSDLSPPSAVLQWLSNLPVVGSSWEMEDSGITLQSFRYTTVERPEEGRKSKRYRVKVDVEIHSPSNVLARQFHETLLQPNDFVDTKEEVRWSAKAEIYHASFFLKKKNKG